jgi:thiamine pyrophosphokinase
LRAIVVAGSSLDVVPGPEALTGSDLLVAVDGGADVLRRLGLRPDLLIGDMDSVSESTRIAAERDGVEMVLLPTAKDETDAEAALRLVVARGAMQVTVYGALGGPRLDHLLGNLLLLAADWLKGAQVRLVDGRHEASLAHGDVTVMGQAGDILSLLPLTPFVLQVTTAGLEYPLKSETLIQAATRGISNVMTGSSARVTHGDGALLVVHYQGR